MKVFKLKSFFFLLYVIISNIKYNKLYNNNNN